MSNTECVNTKSKTANANNMKKCPEERPVIFRRGTDELFTEGRVCCC